MDPSYDVSRYPSDAIKTWDAKTAEGCGRKLLERYGSESQIQFAEAYEMSEYGYQLTQEEIEEAFPR